MCSKRSSVVQGGACPGHGGGSITARARVDTEGVFVLVLMGVVSPLGSMREDAGRGTRQAGRAGRRPYRGEPLPFGSLPLRMLLFFRSAARRRASQGFS